MNHLSLSYRFNEKFTGPNRLGVVLNTETKEILAEVVRRPDQVRIIKGSSSFPLGETTGFRHTLEMVASHFGLPLCPVINVGGRRYSGPAEVQREIDRLQRALVAAVAEPPAQAPTQPAPSNEPPKRPRPKKFTDNITTKSLSPAEELQEVRLGRG